MTVPTSAAVSYSNLFTQAHANVFNLLNNRSNVPDPQDSSGDRKFVYVREPRDMSVSFTGFPCIIIPPAELAQENLTVDASKSFIEFDITVRVWAKDVGGQRTSTASGAALIDTISNNIFKTLNNSTNRKTLRNKGLFNFQILSTPVSYEEVSDHNLFMREFGLRFRQVLTVTA